MNNGPIWVVAGAMRGKEGKWLMQRRPLGKPHGGLWEFPGGKMEVPEKPKESLKREFREELGIVITPDHCRPAGFAEEAGATSDRHIVVLLYIVLQWEGEPQSLEGGELGWFSPEEIERLAKLPMDCALAGQIFEKSTANY